MIDPGYKDILIMIRSGLLEEPFSLDHEPAWEQILSICEYQGLSSIVYRAVRISDVSVPLEIKTKLQTTFFGDIRLNRLQMKELEALFASFDDHGIDYLPVKGTVMKALYPDPVFRWMSDSDIVIRPEQYETISEILKEKGYVFLLETNHELTWQKAEFVIEFHRTIFDSDYSTYFQYFRDVFQNAVCREGTHRFEMNATDELIYNTAHLAKHCLIGGTRLRSLIDLYYFLQNKTIDEKRLKDELDQVNLYPFFELVRDTVISWFRDGNPDPKGELLLRTIFQESQEMNDSKKFAYYASLDSKGGKDLSSATKAGTFLRRVFVPYKILQKKYPTLGKAPVLLPFFWVRRGFEVVFFQKDRLDKFMKIQMTDSSESVEAYMNDVRMLGLEEAILPKEV